MGALVARIHCESRQKCAYLHYEPLSFGGWLRGDQSKNPKVRAATCAADGTFWLLNFEAVVLAKRPIRRNSRMTVRVVLVPTNAEELWQVRKETTCQ
jgi:hypothetical protein